MSQSIDSNISDPKTISKRLISIDALRGFVMVIMLIDHVRETFFLHMQVGDPVDVTITSPELFFTRWASSICAPVFIFLTGMSAYLYSTKYSLEKTSAFLFKRGLFLVLLELTLVVFLWTGKYPPDRYYLQVIWCIGLCMIALSGLIYLPRNFQITLGVIIVAGHNLLDGFKVEAESNFFIPWAILYQREVFEIFDGIDARTSYPILPWIGVILLGFCLGPWFAKNVSPTIRKKKLLTAGIIGLISFFIIRYANFYGDFPRINTGEALTTFMSFIALTKYPPSLLFNLSMLSIGLLLLVLFEKYEDNKLTNIMADFGAAPMFYYVFHLAVLKILYLIAITINGPTHGKYFSFNTVGQIWIAFFIFTFLFYFPTRWFAKFKQRNKHIKWLQYF